MKKVVVSLLLVFAVTVSFAQFNLGKAVKAAVNLYSAATVSDAEVMGLAKTFASKLDSASVMLPDSSLYVIRLDSLTKRFQDVGEVKLNYGVYDDPQINAFAMANGTIRVYRGLMDVMTDEEIMAILGHEIGHVVNADSKEAMRNAYLTSAAKDATGIVAGSLLDDLGNAKVADIQLMNVGKNLFNAQFSQKQEREADDYAVAFLAYNQFDPQAMISALSKISKIQAAGGEKADLIARFFSTHPDTDKRIKRLIPIVYEMKNSGVGKS